MPINPKYKANYEEGAYYHIFNRTIGNELMFKNEENYRYFLIKLDKYLSPFVDLLAWCLLPNHFHLLIRVKSGIEFRTLEEFGTLYLHEEITKAFKNFFLSYSQAYKNMHKQKTNVFAPKYKHIKLSNNNDVCTLIQYIHSNPLHHSITEDWENYQWSSFYRLGKKVQSKLKIEEVYTLFGGYNEFIRIHKENIQLYKETVEYEF